MGGGSSPTHPPTFNYSLPQTECHLFTSDTAFSVSVETPIHVVTVFADGLFDGESHVVYVYSAMPVMLILLHNKCIGE